MKRFLSLFLVFTMVILYSSCEIDDTNNVSKEVNNSSADSGESSDSSNNEDQYFKLNETAVFPDLKITATEIKASEGDSLNTPDEGCYYVGVNFTIENISDEDQTISTLLLFTAYVDDIKTDEDIFAPSAFGSSNLGGTFSPGKKMQGYFAVEVKEGSKVLEIEVKDSWLSSVNKASFKLDIPELKKNLMQKEPQI